MIAPEESVDFLCPLCNVTLMLGARQEYGQELTSYTSLIVYGECPNCGEIYTTIYKADTEEMDDVSENGYLT